MLISHSTEILLKNAILQLAAAGIDGAAGDARLLAEHVLGITREARLAGYTGELSEEKAQAFRRAVGRRAGGEPVSKITGRRSFWKHDFIVTRDTLDPRPDTETLIEAALHFFPDPSKALNILDLGAGSGCLLLSLLGEYPRSFGLGVDLSPAALDVAKRNCLQLGLEKRCVFRQGNWCEGIKGKYDLIVANPPYIPSGAIAGLLPDVRDYDPLPALDGGGDGLEAYRLIIPQAVELLASGGLLALEAGAGQERDIQEIGVRAGLKSLPSRADLAGIARAVLFSTHPRS